MLDEEVLLDGLQVANEVAILNQELQQCGGGKCVSGSNDTLNYCFFFSLQDGRSSPGNVQGLEGNGVVGVIAILVSCRIVVSRSNISLFHYRQLEADNQ